MNIVLTFESFEYINVFNLNIFQEEECFARAVLTVEVGQDLPALGTEGILQGEEVYFKGYLAGVPVRLKGHFQDIELIACPLDFSQQLEKLQGNSRIYPYWDPLWVKDIADNKEIQDVHTSSLYYDRRGGDLQRSDWFEGRSSVVFKDNFFKDSLEVCKGKPPLRSCTVNVHAHWIQKEEGIENVGAAIRRVFRASYVNTYTKESFVRKWPEVGHRVGRSGIWVLKSKLEEILPLASPWYSKPLTVREDEGIERAYRAKRYWFKPTLWVRWHYHQRRKETLSFTLSQDFRLFSPQECEEKRVEFTLQNINPDPKAYPWCPQVFYRLGSKVVYKNAIYRCCRAHTSGTLFEGEAWILQKHFYTPLGNPAQASFFLTERGYRAADHALERAKAILARSARALFVSFEAQGECIKDVTTDMSISLYDSRFPGGMMKGKVVKYELSLNGETQEWYGKVTLACSVGCSKGRESQQKPWIRQDFYCDDGYVAQEGPLRYTPSGISYFRYDDCVPPQRAKSGSLLREIKIDHAPEEQEDMLVGLKGLTVQGIERALSEFSTHIKLYFKDLRTRDVIEHEISLNVASRWSAPEHVKAET